MKPIEPYLFFDGNCREAMEFYQHCFGGELNISTYSDAPDGKECPDIAADKIMHAILKSGDLVIMASDSPQDTPEHGSTIHLNIFCESYDQQDEVFAKLKAGGTVRDELKEQFWGMRFGMITDKFGFRWMLNAPKE